MAWVVSVSIDPDKTDVGSASAVFTDDDGTMFVYGTRAQLTAANATAFAAAAVTARNAWQALKTREANAMAALVNKFTAAGETATASAAQ